MEKKKKNILTMKNIYQKCNHNKYSQITRINETSDLKSNYKNLIINFQIPIIIILLITIALLFYTFRTNFVIILYCFLLLLALFALSIFNSTYKLKLDKNNLEIKTIMQKTQIMTKDLINIYLSRENLNFFGVPIKNYMINIIYNNNNAPMLITLPTVMVSRKQLLKLFSNLEIVKIKDEEEETNEKNQNKKKIILAIAIPIFIILLIVSCIYGANVKNVRIDLSYLSSKPNIINRE